MKSGPNDQPGKLSSVPVSGAIPATHAQWAYENNRTCWREDCCKSRGQTTQQSRRRGNPGHCGLQYAQLLIELYKSLFNHGNVILNLFRPSTLFKVLEAFQDLQDFRLEAVDLLDQAGPFPLELGSILQRTSAFHALSRTDRNLP